MALCTLRGGWRAPWDADVDDPRGEAERLEVLYLQGLLTRVREEWGGCRYKLSESARDLLAEGWDGEQVAASVVVEGAA
ncbi:MAG: hypothetical protein IPQ07_40055 [Myxococcales bacterium]|nr:hypothetical protein [Myxococcales bacterium]